MTWSASFRRFLDIHGRLSYVTEDPPSLEDPRLAEWIIQDRAVISWLLKMTIPAIAEPMQLITPSKAIWEEWMRMYGYKSNISRTVDVFENLFKSKQAGRALQEFYGQLRGLLNQLEIYQPYSADITTQRRYREELAVALFLAGLDSPLNSQIRGPILSESLIPTLGEAFSTALSVSPSGPTPSTILSTPDTTALVSITPRGRGHGQEGGHGRGRPGRGRDGQLYPPCEHCQKYGHRSDRCWKKFGKLDQVAHSTTTEADPTTLSLNMIISRSEYD